MPSIIFKGVMKIYKIQMQQILLIIIFISLCKPIDKGKKDKKIQTNAITYSNGISVERGAVIGSSAPDMGCNGREAMVPSSDVASYKLSSLPVFVANVPSNCRSYIPTTISASRRRRCIPSAHHQSKMILSRF